MKEIQKQLEARFTTIAANGEIVDNHKWKVQTTKTGMAVCVPYLDSRQVTTRLNNVLGIDGWSNTLIETSDSGMICEITIIVNGKEVTRSNVGTKSEYEAKKGMASDSIKRAAVNFGVGSYLYDMQPVKLKIAIENGKKYAATAKGEALKTGEALTSYINQKHPLRAKLTEIYNALDNNDKKEVSDNFTKIWNKLV